MVAIFLDKEQKQISPGVKYPSSQTLTGMVIKNLFAKMTRKDDPTISCSHLMVELSIILAGWGNRKGVVTTTLW